MHSGHVQATDTNTKARMMMDTKVAKMTRSLTLPVMSSPTALRGPSLSRRSLQALRVTPFCHNGLRRAAPSQESQCFRFEAGCPDGRHRIPLVRQYFLIATENLIDAGDASVQNSWIARGAHSRDASWNIAAFGMSSEGRSAMMSGCGPCTRPLQSKDTYRVIDTLQCSGR
jgi:hypothetical protein